MRVASELGERGIYHFLRRARGPWWKMVCSSPTPLYSEGPLHTERIVRYLDFAVTSTRLHAIHAVDKIKRVILLCVICRHYPFAHRVNSISAIEVGTSKVLEP